MLKRRIAESFIPHWVKSASSFLVLCIGTAAALPSQVLITLHTFDPAYRKAKCSSFGQGQARLQQGSRAAATTMLKLMLDTGVPPSTRLRAADCVFSHAKHAIEIEEIEARLAALEQAAEQEKKSRRN